ncbi:hypothetical protein L228DRAFT_247179 [Xylona heveae TC161]|uniref:Cyclin-D1-binding protein 1-like N-terminal domain-containing protein n=1 Tax=Xylona heveae (strain CBS 132557 / TC161) TaxID=1328760 RepID=A0A165GZF2_XYLHT|nr:hypothetical protein L228DRAFT_247179 [Xylona heveae TC161]KZF22793.1 hypothetical protein L228DRAFT_247179 [Xylona heveae TC161]
MSSTSTSQVGKDLQSLRSTVESTLGLLQQFQTSLNLTATASTAVNGNKNDHNDNIENQTLPNDLPNPLDVLHTAGTLLRAHTTKLGLLMINKPFTPSAITTVLREVQTGCLPAIMGAVEICCAQNESTSNSSSKPSCSQTLQTEVRARVRRVFAELPHLMHEILRIAEVGRGTAASPASAAPSRQAGVIHGGSDSRDSLASTGVVWDACDSLMELRDKGLAGIVVKKAEGYRDMLNDAITELREWSEEVESSDDDDEDDDEDDAENSDDDEDNAQAKDLKDEDFDDLFASSNKLPKNDTKLRAQLESSLKKLKLLSTLYQALIKRRLQSVPTESTVGTDSGEGEANGDASREDDINATIDALMAKLKAIPDGTDELANAFYELDGEEAASEMDKCVNLAKESIALVRTNWVGGGDEFTAWSAKWIEFVEKA